MQMHHYLDEILGSKSMLRLMRSLVEYEGKTFTVRKLAQESGVSATEAALVVKQLEKFGILRVQQVGRSYLLTLNSDSYIVKSVLKPALKAEHGTVKELVNLLRRHLDDKVILSATLFGSVVAGEERKDSDIDLLVVSDDFEGATTLVSRARDSVARVFNGRLSPLVMSRKELVTKKDGPLLRSIRENYIHVAGKDLSEVIAGD
ncbi:MAG: nucleotidyltransferase domain-containing protein [Nitrososphaera sp.]